MVQPHEPKTAPLPRPPDPHYPCFRPNADLAVFAAADQAGDEAQVAQISAQQDRIRRNMAALDRTSPLYKRYVAELETQETQIANLRADAQRQRDAAAAAQKALRDMLDGLEI